MQRAVLVSILLVALVALASAVPVRKTKIDSKLSLRRIPEEDIKNDPWSGIDNDNEESARALGLPDEPSLIPGETKPYHQNNPYDPSKLSRPVNRFLDDDGDGDDDYHPWDGPDSDPDRIPILNGRRYDILDPSQPSLIPGELKPYHQNKDRNPTRTEELLELSLDDSDDDDDDE